MRQLVRSGAALTLVLAVGCSAAGGESSARNEAGERTVVTSCGRELSFAEPPERAVTLDQSSTETLLELGLADRMAGTSYAKTEVAREYRDAYEKVPVLSPDVLTGEQLRAAAPDVVVSSFSDLYSRDRVGTREELEAVGLPSYVSAVDCPERAGPDTTVFDLLLEDYENLGRIFGVEDRAAELSERQRAAVAEAEAAAAGGDAAEGPTVVWLYSVYNGVPYVAGRGGMPSEMSRLVGARNAFDDIDEDWPEVSWEAIADRDPDVIVVGDLSERGAPGDSADEKRAMMREDPVVSKLTAVREDHLIEVPGIEMDPSVRTVNTLRLLVEGMRELGHVG
ncbi:ABC transporter substrate-binding protein [Streptomyces sp. CNQ085]|uniref:ABC transporter substrate-binding protein n=1 Tax=Streptomyces sp. CNQ085 TaxID=2886944 RepID=UPI001F512D46|nr:ABC transporter substrate-binding protein [Streptomyces sp. CNQ085]MCI0384607.1 ABC transporter substrate-binding protein [Streptomyces sp. CNQ085]